MAPGNPRGNTKRRRYDNSTVPDNVRGIVVSVIRPMRVRHGLQEIVKLINAIWGPSIHESTPATEKNAEAHFDDELNAELDSIKQEGREKFVFYEICRGVGFVTTPQSIPAPSKLCAQICKHVREDASVRIYDAARISPVDLAVSPATLDSMMRSKAVLEYLKNLFPLAYGEESEDSERIFVKGSWKVELNRRNNSLASRTLWFDMAHAASLGAPVDAIKDAALSDAKTEECPAFQELIVPLKEKETPYKIAMAKPAHTIVFEVNLKFIGLGIMAEHEEFCKYNLATLCGQKIKPDQSPPAAI